MGFQLRWFSVLAALSVCPASASEQLVSEIRTAFLWRQTLVVPQSEFTPELLEARFRRFIGSASGRANIVQVEVYTDPKEARSGNCKCVTDVSYLLWRDLYSDYVQRLPAAAEFTMVGEDSVMRLRLQSGRILKKIISGRDPAVFEHSGTVFEIVFISPAQPGSTRTTPFLFLRSSGAISIGAAEALTQQLGGYLRNDKIDTHFREDAWFITSDAFPVVYLFDAALAPPTKEQYELSAQISCIQDGRWPRCRPVKLGAGSHPGLP